MSSQYTPGNRNSTPETLSSNLRPPVSRASMAGSHQLRNSVDTGAFPPQAGRSGRPASEVIYNQGSQGQKRDSQGETMEKATKKWIEDIDQCEAMLDEMAAAALDAEFKDELSAIEQWFKVLSEAERTAALYALLQQTTQVQIRFFVGVLQQMSKSHPASVMLSPSGPGDRDSHRFSQVGKIGDRNSLAVNRNSQATGNKRNSGLDYDEIKSMFPEAAAAIAQQRADFEQQTGAAPQSTRDSVVGDRSSLAAPSVASAREEGKRDLFGPKSPVSWRRSEEPQAAASRPKSSSGQQPMGQFGQQPQQQQQQAPTSSFRRPMPLSNEGLQNQSMGHFEAPLSSMFSPMNGGWASAMATPMVPGFGNMMQGPNMSDIAAATHNKLNAVSTITNRMNLDNPSNNYRRARSTEGDRGGMQPPPQHLGMGGVLRDQTGQILSPEQAAMMQAQMLGMGGQRSPTHSPARGPPTAGLPGMPQQNNGFLSVFGSNPANINHGMAGLSLGGYGGADPGYLSDASEINRGRSPRGRRGTSKPPEDPTNPDLLDDVPAWLRTLRLHKYTDNLKDMKWTDIVQLDDEGLEKRGITAKGARTKMLKVFEQVRDAQGTGKL